LVDWFSFICLLKRFSLGFKLTKNKTNLKKNVKLLGRVKQFLELAVMIVSMERKIFNNFSLNLQMLYYFCADSQIRP